MFSIDPERLISCSTRVVYDIMDVRGYIPDVPYSKEESVTNRFKLDFTHSVKGSKLRVLFDVNFDGVSTGVALVRDYCDSLISLGIPDALLVTNSGVTHGANTHLRHMESMGLFIASFKLKELQYNILRHQDVPLHSVVSGEELKELLKKYNPKDMPQILLREDKVCRLMGFRAGDIIRVDRPDLMSGKIVVYRTVVDS
jgi:DNA-directed RNA polymerase subunit H (RpoH/RPB5)